MKETTYTVTRTIIVSTIAQTTSYVSSATAPADTTVLWFDTTANQLKRYKTSAWVVVNDFSDEISDVAGRVGTLEDTVDKLVPILDKNIIITEVGFDNKPLKNQK